MRSNRFIRLTCNFDPRNPVMAYIDAAKIEAVVQNQEDDGCHVLIPSHRNGGFKVAELPGEVLELIDEALEERP